MVILNITALVESLVKSGATPEMILSAVKSQEEYSALKRESARQRQISRREKLFNNNDRVTVTPPPVTVTECDKKDSSLFPLLPLSPNTPIPLTPKTHLQKTYSIEFEEFLSAYPKNNGAKKPAFEKYQTARKQGITHETLIRGARGYEAFTSSEGTERRFIAHAATWLNQRRWESDYTSPQGNNGRGYRPGKGAEALAAANEALAELGVGPITG